MPDDWTKIEIRTRRDADGSTTYELPLSIGLTRIRDHADGSVRLAGPRDSEWTYANGPSQGNRVPREHYSPVVRVRPAQ